MTVAECDTEDPAGSESTRRTIYTCYVTEKKKLIGIVDVKRSSDRRGIQKDRKRSWMRMYFTQGTLDDQEYVANMINKYGLVAIPIIDHEGLSRWDRNR